MKEKILITEDEFAEADYLRLLLIKHGYKVIGMARSVTEAREMINEEKPDFVLLDIFLKGKLTGIDLARELQQQNIPFIYLSANSDEQVLNLAKATQPYGFLVKPYREKDLLVTLEIARYRHEHSKDTRIDKQNRLKEKLTGIIQSIDHWETKLLNTARALQSHIGFDYITAGFNAVGDLPVRAESYLRTGYDEYQRIGIPELINITGLTASAITQILSETIIARTPEMFNGTAFENICTNSSVDKLFSDSLHMRSRISLPFLLPDGLHFNLNFYSRKPETYDADHLELLSSLQKPIAESLESMFRSGNQTTSGISVKKPELSDNGRLLAGLEFEGIIGKSHLLLNVFDMITQVAGSDTSVLILGESGTGKERIAESIHNLSPRKNMPLVKVNCATLPASLIESELFGHEKGSFTGALDKRIGKFEKADKGTIFLDEIGEMSLDLQVKLLRVLQEKYIERIGAMDPTGVDVRIVAATNRNLEKEVAEGRFRLDLYYRLNVFPVELPPLRERLEDIPALAAHFVNYFSRKSGKKITGLSDKVLTGMAAYHWPGNIRELENLIERSVLLTKGAIIEDIAIPGIRSNGVSAGKTDLHIKTIEENERDHIISVLRKYNGRIAGEGGAAEILNVPPSTLRSKMKKLDIRKEDFE